MHIRLVATPFITGNRAGVVAIANDVTNLPCRALTHDAPPGIVGHYPMRKYPIRKDPCD